MRIGVLLLLFSATICLATADIKENYADASKAYFLNINQGPKETLLKMQKLIERMENDPSVSKTDKSIVYQYTASAYAVNQLPAFIEEHLNKALEYNPENLSALVNRAIMYKKTGRNELAQEDYEKVKSIDPDYRGLKILKELFKAN